MLVHPCPCRPPATPADLQGQLAVARDDMERLQRLIDDACGSLLRHFVGATRDLDSAMHRVAAHPEVDAHELQAAMAHLAGAVTAMQFQDLASQLVDHTARRLRDCSHGLAGEPAADEPTCALPPAAANPGCNPVTQQALRAGSVELF